jgi:hypothetical protein
MRPAAPASRARSRRAAICARVPLQYVWKNVTAPVAVTASTDLLAKLLSPIAVPRLAAARATATSPSGCTAWTPTGEMITGRDRRRTHDRALEPAPLGLAGRARRQLELVERHQVLAERPALLLPSDECGVDGCGKTALRAPFGHRDGLEAARAHRPLQTGRRRSSKARRPSFTSSEFA